MITKQKIINILKTINDPEISIDIWTLGLIYDIIIKGNKLKIKMTFTSPMCPYGPMLVEEIKQKLKEENIQDVDIEIVFSPVWQPSEDVKDILGI